MSLRHVIEKVEKASVFNAPAELCMEALVESEVSAKKIEELVIFLNENRLPEEQEKQLKALGELVVETIEEYALGVDPKLYVKNGAA